MKKNRLYYWLGAFLFVFAIGCEDLEDTYDEFAGDGKIRYIGKCDSVEAASGWERIRLSWKNNIDAAVKRVKITWQSEADAAPFVRFIERTETNSDRGLRDTTYLEGLSDATYAVTISNLSADSTESIVETLYTRPYTENHEDLRTFTRGILSFFRLNGDKLAVILDEDNALLEELILNFWDTEGNEHNWDVKQRMNETLRGMRDYMFLLPEEEGVTIDFTKPLLVKRKGRIEECIDEIPFKDEVLDLSERILSVSFTQWLEKNYGPDWNNHIDQIEEVELDYDMTTLQDLLYFPNLKKVILGKNRFMAEGHNDENLSVTDTYIGLVTLQMLKASRPDFIVERYNGHYFDAQVKADLEEAGKVSADLITEHLEFDDNYEFMPDITPLNTDDWVVTCSDTMYNGLKTNGAGWLLDGDAATYFEPGQTLAGTVFEVEIDMQEGQTLHGFKVQQPATETATDLAYLLNFLQVEVSEDGYVWQQATYEEGSVTIGDALGEITFVPVPEALQGRNVRYIRLTMTSQHTSDISGGTPLFSLRLGDVVPY